MEGEHLITWPDGFVTFTDDPAKKNTFTFALAGKEVFRITPEGVVIVQGDAWEAAKVFWDVVQQMAPPGWKVEKEPQGKEVV